jgi:hypothetical protein
MKAASRLCLARLGVKTSMPAGNAIQSSYRMYLIDLALLLSVFVVFATSRVHALHDAQYSILVSENLLRHGTFAIDERAIARLAPFAHPGIVGNGYPYQVEVVNGKLLYGYPIGSSILSLPFVALMNAGGISVCAPDGTYNQRGEKLIQEALAAWLMAVLTVVFFRTALILLPLSWSIVLSLGAALSTQIWSTTSRALWSHTWQIMLLGLVVHLLLSQEEKATRDRPVMLATLLAWAYFVRPTSSIPIAAVSIYIALFRRETFIAYAVTGGLWAAGFIACSLTVYGQTLPSYYHPFLTLGHFWDALTADLISPSRGLFVFVPATAFVLYLAGRYRRSLPHLRLAVLSLCIIAAHMVVISMNPGWWGGHSYGPRLATDIIPWFFLLAVLGCLCLHDEPASTLKRVTIAAGVLTLVIGALINGHGARSGSTEEWANVPRDIDHQPQRVWDWSDPQFLAGLHFARPK